MDFMGEIVVRREKFKKRTLRKRRSEVFKGESSKMESKFLNPTLPLSFPFFFSRGICPAAC